MGLRREFEGVTHDIASIFPSAVFLWNYEGVSGKKLETWKLFRIRIQEHITNKTPLCVCLRHFPFVGENVLYGKVESELIGLGNPTENPGQLIDQVHDKLHIKINNFKI